jgi:release factor glutamine methyltransferase
MEKMPESLEPSPPWTPLKIIQWAVPFLKQKGIQNPKFDAEILLAHALRMDRLKVYLQFDRPLEQAELSLIRESLKRRARHEPIQYITGHREFFGLDFLVREGVLIPRPETEQLVEMGLEFLKSLPENPRNILDLGTGSGCIAISLAKNIFCQVWAVDIQEEPLALALENAQNLGVADKIQWRLGDWFSSLKPDDPQQFQLILSNPPYISLGEKGELDPEVRDYEPEKALFSGESGLEAYEILSKTLEKKLAPGGVALLELHSLRSEGVLNLFKRENLRASLFPDLQGHLRVLKLEKSSKK